MPMQKFTNKLKFIISISMLLLFSASMSGQPGCFGIDGTCDIPWGHENNVTHFCTDGVEPYEAGTENKTLLYFIPHDPLRGLGCLDWGGVSSRYVPTWFIFRVGKVINNKIILGVPACGATRCADISFKIAHIQPDDPTKYADIDFSSWGPFYGNSKKDVLDQIYTGLPFTLPPMPNTDGRCGVDQMDYPEICTITNAKEGEWYLLLVTNYSMKPGLISFNAITDDVEISCPTPTGIGMDPEPVCENENQFSLKPVFAEGEEPDPSKMQYEWEAPSGITLTPAQKTAEVLILKRENSPNGTLLDYNGRYYLSMTYEGNPPRKFEKDVVISKRYEMPKVTAVVKERNLPYKFGGEEFSATGIYTVNPKTVVGCDSILTLDLTVLKTVFGTDGKTICASELPWKNPLSNTIFYVAGYETIDLTAVNGADSVLTFTLKVINDIPSVTGLISSESGFCEEEGKTIDLNAINVSPVGATIRWFQNGNPIPDSDDKENITVVPLFTGTSGYTSQNTYKVVVEFCGATPAVAETKVSVDKPLTGSITGDSLLCTGGTTLNASSYNATTYSWTIDGSSNELGNRSTFPVAAVIATTEPIVTTYRVEMTRGKCSAEETFTVTVFTLPRISRIDSIGYLDRKIIADENYGTPPFLYGVDGKFDEYPEKFNLSLGLHTFVIEDVLGCRSKEVTHTVRARMPIFPSFFSPNGDGENDTWDIINLRDYYPNATVEIYDRSGRLVAKYPGSHSTGWDGTWNGQPMPSTDYWYIVDDDGLDQAFVGHFTLIRR